MDKKMFLDDVNDVPAMQAQTEDLIGMPAIIPEMCDKAPPIERLMPWDDAKSIPGPGKSSRQSPQIGALLHVVGELAKDMGDSHFEVEWFGTICSVFNMQMKKGVISAAISSDGEIFWHEDVNKAIELAERHWQAIYRQSVGELLKIASKDV
jgi:hypothetical protein